MKRIRLENLKDALEERAPTPASRIRSHAQRPDKPVDRELIDAWLAERWPRVFGAVWIPVAADLFVKVRNEAQREQFPSWALGYASTRSIMRNTHYRMLQIIARPGNFWHDLNGDPLRPILEEERHWADVEIYRLMRLRNKS